MYRKEMGGRPEAMIRKDMLQHSLSLRIPNTEIDKSFNVGRTLAAHWIKFYQLSNVLRETEDDNEMIQILRETHQFHPNVGSHDAVGISEQRVLKQSKQD